jgi:hypothetical protein
MPAQHVASLACQTWQVTPADTAARSALLRQGFVLEWVTLAWNVAGILVLGAAYLGAASTALLSRGAHRTGSARPLP